MSLSGLSALSAFKCGCCFRKVDAHLFPHLSMLP
jgi:hypothetical protein